MTLRTTNYELLGEEKIIVLSTGAVVGTPLLGLSKIWTWALCSSGSLVSETRMSSEWAAGHGSKVPRPEALFLIPFEHSTLYSTQRT